LKIVRSNNTSASYNLALEEFLFTEFQDEFLLFYVNNPCVILGSNQAVQNEVDLDFCTATNIQLGRRKSGGYSAGVCPGLWKKRRLCKKRCPHNRAVFC
jgi:lipoate-protein ligase A